MSIMGKLLDRLRLKDEVDQETNYGEIQTEKISEEERQDELSNSFEIDDMYQFSEIPFEWQWVTRLNHTNGIAWFMLNMNNQYVALSAIGFINGILEESKKYTGLEEKLYICTENIDFFYPVPMRIGTTTNTFVQCVPYTKTGKISKYPAILHFKEIPEKIVINGTEILMCLVHGSIYFMRDGNIGKANIYIKDYWIQIRLKGINLVVQRIGKNTSNGNVDIYKQKL